MMRALKGGWWMVVGEGLAVHGAEGLAEEDSGGRRDRQGSGTRACLGKIEIVGLGLVFF
jgi:hypothetical protein